MKGYTNAAAMVTKFGKSHPFTKFYQEQLAKAPESYAFFRKYFILFLKYFSIIIFSFPIIYYNRFLHLNSLKYRNSKEEEKEK